MHFEILVEDYSGKLALENLVPQILGTAHTFKIHFYKGIGKIPKGLAVSSDPQKRILLAQLPKLIRGYGKAFAAYPSTYQAVVVIVCDLDDRCLKAFRNELIELGEGCSPSPSTFFCIAIEEGEAWFLGDLPAIRIAYPRAKDHVLYGYKNDSICGTWETLADAVYPGGAAKLSKQGWRSVGQEKANWAKMIPPLMDVDNNESLSFRYFRDKLRTLMENE